VIKIPKAFENCVKKGGKVRTVSGPSKEHGLKKGEYVKYCTIGGKSYRGEVKKKKQDNAEGAEMNKSVSTEKRKIPKSGLQFDSPADILFSKEGGDNRKAYMKAYTGQPMEHWLFGKVVVDVSGLDFENKKKFPILEEHNRGRKIGFSAKPTTDNNAVELDEFELLNNDVANEFYENANAGFPYQASISIRPRVIEEVAEDVKAEVNGYTLKGPASIVRKARYNESSVCVFGADNKTSVGAFSESEMEETEVEIVRFTETETKLHRRHKIMDLKEMKEQYPTLLEEFKKEVTEELQASHQTEMQKKDKEIADLKASVSKSETEKSELNDRVQSLEKKDFARTEKEIQASAFAVVTKRLEKTGWSARFKEKMRGFMNHEQFVDENNVFDEAKFAEYVDKEVKDMEASLEDTTKPKIDGLGFSEEHDDETGGQQFDADKEADKIVGLISKNVQ